MQCAAGTDSMDTTWDKLRVPLAHLYLFLSIFECSLSITQLYGGPLLVLWWREQATRTTRNFPPRKICLTKKLQKSQKVAKKTNINFGVNCFWKEPNFCFSAPKKPIWQPWWRGPALQVRRPKMQDLGSWPLYAEALWRLHVESTVLYDRPVTRRSKGISPEKIFVPLEKCVGYALKLLDIVQKIWAPLRKHFTP